jgi:glutaredoxin
MKRGATAGRAVNPNLKVYWRPGCSSCVRVKEFLAQLGVPYESIDVAARPEAMEELLALGVKTVPVVARGRDYVFAQALEDVSRFIGREFSPERPASGRCTSCSSAAPGTRRSARARSSPCWSAWESSPTEISPPRTTRVCPCPRACGSR